LGPFLCLENGTGFVNGFVNVDGAVDCVVATVGLPEAFRTFIFVW